MKQINDHLRENLSILFVGFNPSIRSSETGHHYANPNNRFWKIIHEAGITPRRYAPSEDQELLELGYGFTNIVARPTRTAEEITKEEYTAGRQELRRKIERYKPAIVCYVGKGVYQQFSRRKEISWGIQAEEMVQGTMDFVAPSSSGLVRMKLDEIINIYCEMPNLLYTQRK
jgi:double-stranded uracil-DNA glycosylase